MILVCSRIWSVNLPNRQSHHSRVRYSRPKRFNRDWWTKSNIQRLHFSPKSGHRKPANNDTSNVRGPSHESLCRLSPSSHQCCLSSLRIINVEVLVHVVPCMTMALPIEDLRRWRLRFSFVGTFQIDYWTSPFGDQFLPGVLKNYTGWDTPRVRSMRCAWRLPAVCFATWKLKSP
jgi:hypothetical protein